MVTQSFGVTMPLEMYHWGTTTNQSEGACPHCSGNGSDVYHIGGPCPQIKAVEYFPDGTIKRIEYKDGE